MGHLNFRKSSLKLSLQISIRKRNKLAGWRRKSCPRQLGTAVPPPSGPLWCETLLGWSIFSSVPLSHVQLCDPRDCSTPGFPVHHQLPELTQIHVHRVSDVIHLIILCRPLLLPPSIFPSISVFPSESVLPIRWPKYWSFSFSISPSNEYS